MLLADESVAVIGGGIAGSLLAIELKRVGYGRVVLFEAAPDIFRVATRGVSELHSGAEYPFDARTGEDCIRALVAFRRRHAGLSLAKPKTHFLVSEGSRSDGLTLARYVEHLDVIKTEYERLIRLDPTVEDILGEPSKLWRRLAPDEYGDVLNTAAGYETPQQGLDTEALAIYVKASMAEVGVELHLGSTVTDVERRGAGKFVLHIASETMETSQAVSQVALANHAAGLGLAHRIADRQAAAPNVFAGLRLIVKVSWDESRTFPMPTRIMVEGDSGAMDCPLDANRALVYQPTLSQIAKVRLDPPYDLPGDWWSRIKQPTDADWERAAQVVDRAATIAYPYLRGAQVTEPIMAVSLSTAGESRRRRNPPVVVVCADVVSVALTTKATFATINAEKATRLLMRHASDRIG